MGKRFKHQPHFKGREELRLLANEQAIASYVQREGYEYVSPETISSHLTCLLTLNPLIRPVVTPCDHTFSTDELLKWMQTLDEQPPPEEEDLDVDAPPYRCPLCREGFRYYEIKPASLLVRGMLDDLLVKCSLRQCSWQGKRTDLEHHLVYNCSFTIVNCPENGCHMQFARADAARHDEICLHKLVACQHCHELRPRWRLEGLYHSLSCTALPAPCTHCGAKIIRRDLPLHEATCQQRLSPCPVAHFGCPALFTQADRAYHLGTCPYLARIDTLRRMTSDLLPSEATENVLRVFGRHLIATLEQEAERRIGRLAHAVEAEDDASSTAPSRSSRASTPRLNGRKRAAAEEDAGVAKVSRRRSPRRR